MAQLNITPTDMRTSSASRTGTIRRNHQAGASAGGTELTIPSSRSRLTE
jgi:hypothetical protein